MGPLFQFESSHGTKVTVIVLILLFTGHLGDLPKLLLFFHIDIARYVFFVNSGLA